MYRRLHLFHKQDHDIRSCLAPAYNSICRLESDRKLTAQTEYVVYKVYEAVLDRLGEADPERMSDSTRYSVAYVYEGCRVDLLPIGHERRPRAIRQKFPQRPIESAVLEKARLSSLLDRRNGLQTPKPVQ